MVQYLELHGHIDDVVSIDVWRSRLDLVEEVWMVANLLQLHENIQKLEPVFSTDSVNFVNVSSQDALIQLLLDLGETHIHVDLLLLLKRLLHINLEPPQHERLQKSVDLFDDLFLVIRVVLVLLIDDKQVVEVFRRFEERWHKKVEERP